MNNMCQFNLQVMDASISDFVDIDSMAISEKFRSRDVVVVVRYQVLEMVTLLICSPLGHVWRYLDLGDAYGSAWFDELLDRAEKGLLREEIKASRLRGKSLPNGLFELGDVDRLLHPRNYLNSWFQTLNVPPDIVPTAVQRVREWVIQLGCHAVTHIADEVTAQSNWGVVSSKLASQPDHDLFTGLWSAMKFPLWAGDKGIARRLKDQIDSIESTGHNSLSIDAEFMASVRLPEIERRNLRTDRAAAKWLFGASVGADVVNLANLDRMFAGYARLANLLDWPQLYPSAQAILARELPLLDILPIDASVFCDPVIELSQFIGRQEQKYPVLTGAPLLG